MIILSSLDQAHRVNRFILINVIGLSLVIAVFALYPVTTAWTYQGISTGKAHSLGLITSLDHGWVSELLRSRNGEVRSMYVAQGQGLVGFPSFHAVSALLNIWFSWLLRRCRVLIIPINILMIAATPVVGEHYLIDVIAGAGIALASVLIGDRLYRGLATNPWFGLESQRFAIGPNMTQPLI